MSGLRIITNHHTRPLIYRWELTPAELKDYDYTTEDSEFFRYKDNLYCLDDFERIDGRMSPHFADWDGSSNDTFFSGILVRWPREEWGELDTEHVIVGWYYC